jgi:transcriptional regulator with XRE-family HTH domain
MNGTSTAERLKKLRTGAGLSLRGAAGAVGMAPTTYANYENPRRYKKRHLPLDLTNALAAVFRKQGADVAPLYALAGLDLAQKTPVAGGFRDAEMVEYTSPTAADPRLAALAALADGRNCHPWLIRGRALVLAGYLPGDLVLVDHDINDPKRDAVVCAQVYDWEAASARTVLRLFAPPYLVAASPDPAYRKPELVDGDRVMIKGVVVASIRVVD